MKYQITFTEPLLGTLSGNKEIAEEFIISKHPDGYSEEESAMHPDEALEKSSTFFARDDGAIMLWDYQVKGFLKEACQQMINSDTMKKEELKKYRLSQYMYKKTIDQQIFVFPRRIHLEIPEGAKLEIVYRASDGKFVERPLRGTTMRGERICLARSESVPPGTHFNIEVKCLNKNLVEFIPQWMAYGALLGLGQWRSSGMGRFEFKSE